MLLLRTHEPHGLTTVAAVLAAPSLATSFSLFARS